MWQLDRFIHSENGFFVPLIGPQAQRERQAEQRYNGKCSRFERKHATSSRVTLD
jgi:hypothetical protein